MTTAEVPATTLLLVDDEDDLRFAVRLMLTRSGFEVLEAANGQEALEVHAQYAGQIALVLLDLVMPVMDGRETLDALTERDPALPVLICSGYAPDGLGDLQARGERVGYLEKPFRRETLVARVRELVP